MIADNSRVPSSVMAVLARELIRDGYGDAEIYRLLNVIEAAWPKGTKPVLVYDRMMEK